jgi:hypothetical protein
MSRIIEAKAVISAADKTGNVFDKIAAKIKGVEKSAKAFEGMKAPGKFVGDFSAALDKLKATEREMQQIRKSWQNFDQALKSGGPMRASRYLDAVDMWKTKTLGALRQVKAGYNETDRHQDRFFRKAGRYALTAAGLGGGAYAANRVGRAGITAAATGARESARDYLAGMSPEDSKRIQAAAMRSSAAYPSVDSSTMHERLRDTAMGMRSTDKALELSDTIAQGTTVLQSLKGKDKAIEEGRKFFSALDVMGKNVDPKEVKELFNGYIKALGVEGADMDLGGVLQMAKQSRAAGGILSNRFLMTTAPGLGRDLGDSQLGTSLASALSQNIGGRATKGSKAAQQEYGLRDKKGEFLDSRLAMTDPDKYAWEKIIPALKNKGIDPDDNVAVAGALSKLFSNRTVGDVFTKLISQREQYQAKAGQYEKAPGLEGAGPLLRKDPFVGYEGMLAQLRNLATQAPLMDAAASGLAKISETIGSLNKTFSEGSTAEKIGAGMGVGALGAGGAAAGALGLRAAYQWFTGGPAALNASAAALDASAAALTAAAARIAAGSAAGAAAAAAAGGGGAAAAGAGGAAAAAGGSALWTAGAAALPWALGGAALLGGGWAMKKSVEDAGYVGMTSGERLRKQRGGSMRDMLRREWRGRSGADLDPEASTGPQGGGGTGQVTATLTGSAEVSGETTVKVEVTVNPSSELITATATATANAAQLKGMLNANGPGSTGRSSPDAAAPSPKGNTGYGGSH